MIRGINAQGFIVLGLTRREIEGLLAGKVCCFPAGKPSPNSPHICIHFGETNADAALAVERSFGDNMPSIADLRTKPSSEDN